MEQIVLFQTIFIFFIVLSITLEVPDIIRFQKLYKKEQLKDRYEKYAKLGYFRFTYFGLAAIIFTMMFVATPLELMFLIALCLFFVVRGIALTKEKTLYYRKDHFILDNKKIYFKDIKDLRIAGRSFSAIYMVETDQKTYKFQNVKEIYWKIVELNKDYDRIRRIDSKSKRKRK